METATFNVTVYPEGAYVYSEGERVGHVHHYRLAPDIDEAFVIYFADYDTEEARTMEDGIHRLITKAMM